MPRRPTRVRPSVLPPSAVRTTTAPSTTARAVEDGPVEQDDGQGDDDGGVEAPVGSPGGDEEELSISEEEDGTGSRTAEDEDPGGRRD